MQNGNVIPGATASSYDATNSGDYSVRVIASGCSNESSALSVQVTSAPTASISANGATTFCEGGSVSLNASSGVGYSYEWMQNGNTIENANTNMFDVSSSGFYSVLVDNGLCSRESNVIEVVSNAIPNAPVLQINGNNIEASSSEGIIWMLNDEIIEGANGDTVEIFQQGIYTATVSVNGCTSALSNEIEITALSLTANKGTAANLALYPNPSNGSLFFNTTLVGKAELNLFSSDGKNLKKFSIPAIEEHSGFDIQDLSAGIYFLSGTCGSQQVNLKFIKLK